MNITDNWLVGFVDGEGCFFVGVNKNKTMKLKEQVIPEFRIVQHNRDIALLYEIKKFLKCGVVTYNRGKNNSSNVMEFRVRNLDDLSTIVVPFFRKNRLLTIKSISFNYFAEIIDLMKEKQHLTVTGLSKIKFLKGKMNI